MTKFKVVAPPAPPPGTQQGAFVIYTPSGIPAEQPSFTATLQPSAKAAKRNRLVLTGDTVRPPLAD